MNWFIKSDAKKISNVMFTIPTLVVIISVLLSIIFESITTILGIIMILTISYVIIIAFIWEISVPLKLSKIADAKKLINKQGYYLSLSSIPLIIGIFSFSLYYLFNLPERISSITIIVYFLTLFVTIQILGLYRAFIISKTIKSLEVNRRVKFNEYRKYIWQIWFFPLCIFQIQKTIQDIFKEKYPVANNR